MKHTNSILSLMLAAVAVAVAAAPAAADPGFQTDAFLGSHAASTVNADAPGYRGDTKDLYVQSLPPSQPTPTPTATAEIGDDAFSWGAALLGALLASGLLLMALAVARSVARRRRVAAGSRA